MAFYCGCSGSRSRSSFCSTYSTSFSGGHRHAARIGDPRRGVPSVARNEGRGGTPAVQPTTPDGPFSRNGICLGEPVGIRTRDLLIKSQLLYRLSYGLFWPREHRESAASGQSERPLWQATPLQILLAMTKQTPALAKSYKFLRPRDARYIMGLHRSLISWVDRRTPRGARNEG